MVLICSLFLTSTTEILSSGTKQKMKFSIKDFFSKCDKIRRKFVLNHAKHHICSEEQTFAGVQRWEIPKFCPLSS